MRTGFTLIELAIVIIIIGLLTGGIIAGRELINQTQLRSIMAEKENFTRATNTFKAKYNALPGDMKNAVAFWGAMAGSTANGTDGDCSDFMFAGVPASGTKTCNGDGDGTISFSQQTEQITFWKHLSNAQLISGSYSGVVGDNSTGTGYMTMPGFNIPESKYNSAGWGVMDSGYLAVAWQDLDGWFSFGLPLDDGFGTLRPILTVQDAYTIDQKYDDGRPAVGKIRFGAAWSVGCTSGDSWADDAAYDLSNTNVACSLLIKP